MKAGFIHLFFFLTVLFVFPVFFIPAGCGLNTAGHMTNSPVLMEQYREKLLTEQFAYFYCGRENMPYAVVGIDPAYTFDTKFWFPVESGTDLYRKIDHLSNLEPGQDKMYARMMVGPAGNTIGVWFSYYYHSGVIVDDTTHRVQVFNPYKPETRFNTF